MGHGSVGMSTPWIGLEWEQLSRPIDLPWKHPLKERMLRLGEPGAWFFRVVESSSSVKLALPPRCWFM